MPAPRPAAAPEPVVRLVPQLLEWAAGRYGDTPFLLRHDAGAWRGYSFREAARAAHAFAALLAREGVRPGDRVGLLAENRPEWGLAYLAVLGAGAVVVPLDAQHRAAEVGEILATAGAHAAIAGGRHLPVLAQVREARLPGLRLFALDGADGAWAEAQRAFADAPPPPARAQPGDLAAVLFTSGTTGHAKGVMLSHANLLTNVEGVAQTFEFDARDRLLSVLPLHHAFECTVGLLTPLRVGAGVAYARGLDSKQLREDLAGSGATILIGVPLLYEKLLSAIHRGVDAAPAPRRWLARGLLAATRATRALTGARLGRTLLAPLRERAGLGRIRMFACGAAPLAPDVFWGFVDLGWAMVEGYGLTETSPVVCANRPRRPHPGGVGWPLVGVEVRIAAPDAEGDGEIQVRGPNVMLGYYDDPAATADVLRDGWLSTGDLGRFLPDGRVRITGRLKNMIATSAGKKIYPEEVEVQLANSPYVLEVVVTGGRDPRTGREEVRAHVFPNLPALEALAAAQGRACDAAFVEAVLRADVEQRGAALAPYKRVKRVIVRAQEFPKTTTGKIRRHELAAAAPGDARGVA